MATYAGRYDEVLLRKAGNRLAPPAANTTVLVYESNGTTVATLYTDRTKATTAANPVSVDASGNLEFFTDPGPYVVAIRENGVQVATNEVTVTADPTEALFGDGASTASALPIIDSGGHYAGSDVEAALQEVPALISGATSVSAGEKQLYVSSTGDDTASGLTPATAKATVAAALDALNASGTGIAASGTVWVAPGIYDLTAALNVGARQRVKGTNPDATRLRWAGAGPAVRLTGGANCSIEGVEVTITGTDASSVGVKIDASTASINYWKLRDVRITADAKTAGQVGLLLANTAATNIYWGDAESVEISNFATGIDFDNDVTLGINANRFRGVKIHNCTTCIDFGTADGNIFDSLLCDLFTLGITGTGIRNHFHGRLEGGAGSTTYTLGVGSQENWLVVDDNCPNASTDSGTDNIVTALAAGAPKQGETVNQFIAPFYPGFANGDGTVPAGGGNAEWVRLPGITKRITITKIGLEVTVSSGNIDLGLYELNDTTLTRLGSVGGWACPGVGSATLSLSAPVVLRPNKVYYAAVAANNVTAKFKALTGVSTNLLAVDGGNLLYGSTDGINYPLPATKATGGLVTNTVCHCLIAKT